MRERGRERSEIEVGEREERDKGERKRRERSM